MVSFIHLSSSRLPKIFRECLFFTKYCPEYWWYVDEMDTTFAFKKFKNQQELDSEQFMKL